MPRSRSTTTTANARSARQNSYSNGNEVGGETQTIPTRVFHTLKQRVHSLVCRSHLLQNAQLPHLPGTIAIIVRSDAYYLMSIPGI